MTSNSGRRKKKFSHLNKHGALSHRKEFIDTVYIEGVYDKAGNQVIRPMTEEEKAWLNQFNQETESISPTITPEIKEERTKLNVLLAQQRSGMSGDDLEEEISQQKALVDALLKNAGNLYPSLDEIKEFRDRDYDRKNDVFVISRAHGKLASLDLTEYDKFVTEAEPEAEILTKPIRVKKGYNPNKNS